MVSNNQKQNKMIAIIIIVCVLILCTYLLFNKRREKEKQAPHPVTLSEFAQSFEQLSLEEVYEGLKLFRSNSDIFGLFLHKLKIRMADDSGLEKNPKFIKNFTLVMCHLWELPTLITLSLEEKEKLKCLYEDFMSIAMESIFSLRYERMLITDASVFWKVGHEGHEEIILGPPEYLGKSKWRFPKSQDEKFISVCSN